MNRKHRTIIAVSGLSVLCLSFVHQLIVDSKNKTIAAGYLNVNQTSIAKNFDYYKSINEDVVILLHLQDRSIPVMKNDKYFKKDIYGKYDSLGTAYIDSLSVFKNTIIQGHSSAKNDLMFTSLKEYLNKEYFNANKNIVLEKKDTMINLEVIGILSVDLSEEEPYLGWYDTNYRNDSAMIDYVDGFKNHASSFNKDIEIDLGDELVTLVTCDRRYDNGRLILLLKKAPGQLAPERRGGLYAHYLFT